MQSRTAAEREKEGFQPLRSPLTTSITTTQMSMVTFSVPEALPAPQLSPSELVKAMRVGSGAALAFARRTVPWTQ
jgi:hypothetical protein